MCCPVLVSECNDADFAPGDGVYYYKVHMLTSPTWMGIGTGRQKGFHYECVEHIFGRVRHEADERGDLKRGIKIRV